MTKPDFGCLLRILTDHDEITLSGADQVSVTGQPNSSQAALERGPRRPVPRGDRDKLAREKRSTLAGPPEQSKRSERIRTSGPFSPAELAPFSPADTLAIIRRGSQFPNSFQRW
jgi:hypothetical protein